MLATPCPGSTCPTHHLLPEATNPDRGSQAAEARRTIPADFLEPRDTQTRSPETKANPAKEDRYADPHERRAPTRKTNAQLAHPTTLGHQEGAPGRPNARTHLRNRVCFSAPSRREVRPMCSNGNSRPALALAMRPSACDRKRRRRHVGDPYRGAQTRGRTVRGGAGFGFTRSLARHEIGHHDVRYQPLALLVTQALLRSDFDRNCKTLPS